MKRRNEACNVTIILFMMMMLMVILMMVIAKSTVGGKEIINTPLSSRNSLIGAIS